jgi:hypothetical protein
MTRTLLLCLLLGPLLAGCAPKIVRVEVPVIVPCLGADPEEPTYLYGVGDYPGDGEAARAALRDLNAAKGYADQLKAQAAGCRGEAPAR